MNRNRPSWTRRIVPAALAAGFLLLASLPASAQAAEGEVRKKVRVESPGAERRVVMIRQAEEGDGTRPKVLTRVLGGGYLGVELTALTPELRRHFGAPEDRGVMVARVQEGSPAERAGLAVGDIVTEVDGEAVEGAWDLGFAIRRREAGEEADLAVWRDGRSLDFRVTVEEREREQVHLDRLLRFGPDGEQMFLSPEDGPQVFHWKRGGDAPEILFDAEGLQELGDSLGKVDWPRFEGRLMTERNRELEERLKRLEKQLAELEKALRESEERRH